MSIFIFGLSGLSVPYQIGQYIEKEMPNIHLDKAPNPTYYQMAQGIILEVGTVDYIPRALWTRYGRWELVSTSQGSQKKVFEVLIKTLGLKKTPLLSNAETSYWYFSDLTNPIIAPPSDFIPYKEAQEAIQDFLGTSKKHLGRL